MENTNEATYNFGKEEYTKKNLTPTEILDLAFAYTQTPITRIVGKKLDDRIKTANDVSRLTGMMQLEPTKKSGKPALILHLLKNSLVTKDEYIKLFKELVEVHKSIVKYLKNASPERRNAGAAKAAAKDMKGEFDESVNEAQKKLPKFKNIPSWAKYVAQHSDGEWFFYEETPTMIRFKSGGGAWKQDGNQIYAGVKTDGKDWDKRPTYYYVKNGKITESVNEASNDYSPLAYAKLVAKGKISMEKAIKDTGYPFIILSKLVRAYNRNYKFEGVMNEGHFGEIDIMAQEASNFREFVKDFYKEYKDFPKDRDTMKWLESLYKSRANEGLDSQGMERVADGLPQTEEEPKSENIRLKNLMK